MKWWRAAVAVAALLLVVVAAGGTSPVTFVNRLDDRPPPQDAAPQMDVPLPNELPDVFVLPLTAYLVFLAGLVLFGLIGIILAVELPRWRRGRGVRGVEAEGVEMGESAAVRRVEKALQEFTEHPNRPPRDAVIAAWLALEAAEERLPHQTPTEFTEKLGVDAVVLKDLYQRARFGHEDVTAAQAGQARQELSRIVRELA